MRADRLVAVLLILQRRGQVTAAEVADELEISPRTARRDLEALAVAGLPVYSVAGRGGGWRLLGDGTTDLTGLSTPETVALFALIGAVGEGDMTSDTRGALRKLTGALPVPMRDAAERAAQSTRTVGGGWSAWGVGVATSPIPVATELVERVRAGIVGTQRLAMAYRGRDGRESTREIDPLGLVDKGGRWYLVAGTAAGQRTFRLDRVVECRPTGETFERPADFDLDAAWAAIESGVDELVMTATATAVVEPGAMGLVGLALGERLARRDRRDDGTTEIEVRGRQDLELAAVLAGFRPWLRVTGPEPVLAHLADIGRTLVADRESADQP